MIVSLSTLLIFEFCMYTGIQDYIQHATTKSIIISSATFPGARSPVRTSIISCHPLNSKQKRFRRNTWKNMILNQEKATSGEDYRPRMRAAQSTPRLKQSTIPSTQPTCRPKSTRQRLVVKE
uniref:Secreted protein n=1 Tax=Rousettus aegyptiacus TaxID=9407 RepID=A0A7J8EKM0_ROUAE|nr:hypothetical protein HJG63_012457 [Rousettus aegyptiacus]